MKTKPEITVIPWGLKPVWFLSSLGGHWGLSSTGTSSSGNDALTGSAAGLVEAVRPESRNVVAVQAASRRAVEAASGRVGTVEVESGRVLAAGGWNVAAGSASSKDEGAGTMVESGNVAAGGAFSKDVAAGTPVLEGIVVAAGGWTTWKAVSDTGGVPPGTGEMASRCVTLWDEQEQQQEKVK